MIGQFEPDEEYRQRQRARNRVTAVILVAFAILFFAITIVRIGEH